MLMNLQSFGENLKKQRKLRQLSQSQVGKKINVTLSAIGYWEQGKRNMPIEKLFAFCSALNIEPYQLFLDKNEVVKLTKEEQKMIADYRQLKNPKTKEAIKSLLDSLT